MNIRKKTNILWGAAFASCALIMAASAVSANSPRNVTGAVAMPARPSVILAIAGPGGVGTLGTIFFGEGVTEGSGQHFGGPR